MENKDIFKLFAELLLLILNDEDISPKDGDPNFNKKVEKIDTKSHNIVTETWESVDGQVTYQKTILKSKSTIESENILPKLEKDLKKAVELQNFEKACELRDQITKLKDN